MVWLWQNLECYFDFQLLEIEILHNYLKYQKPHHFGGVFYCSDGFSSSSSLTGLRVRKIIIIIKMAKKVSKAARPSLI